MSTPINAVNPSKKNNILGNVFHLFYPDVNTSFLFDRDLTDPIIWGSKNVVMTNLKNIDKLSEMLTEDSKIVVFSYIMTGDGYHRKQTYNGLVSGIGAHILRV